MARDFNQQNPDGTWWHVTQDNNGNYSHTVISDPTVAAAANPVGTVVPNGGATTTADMLAGLDAAAGGYWNGNRTDPAAVAAAYHQAGAGGGGTGTDSNIAAANAAATAVYQNGLIANLGDRLAFDKATQAWTQTFQQGQANNTNALGWLGLASKLTGPANAFEYAKLLTGTPGGLADVVRAAGGAYQMPAFGGGSGGTSTPLSIQSMINDLNQYSPNGGGTMPATAPAAGPAGTYQTVNGTKTLAQMQAELKTAGWGGNFNDANAVAAAYGNTTKGTVTPNAATGGSVAPAAATVAVPATGQTTQQSPAPPVTSSYVPQYGALPTSGNQLSPNFMNNADPSQTALLGDAVGNSGSNWQDILAQYQKSLKAYGGPSGGSVGF